MPLVRFEASGNTYTLPSTIGAYSTNFGDAVPRTTRLPGLDGGFDEYGSNPAAREIGSIRQAFTLQSDTKEGLDALRDAVNAMMGWGKGYLYFRPSNYPTQVERRVAARISNINMPQDPSDGRNLYWQRVTVIWQCSNPIWEATGTASSETINHLGTTTNDTATNNGTALALPLITVATGAGDALTQPWKIQRIVSSVVVDELEYKFTLPQNTTVIFDCRDSSIIYNDGTPVDGYVASLVDFIHPDWLRILPGVNNIHVVSAGGSDEATVTIEWRDCWY